jgi:hypothetical protein
MKKLIIPLLFIFVVGFAFSGCPSEKQHTNITPDGGGE